MIGGPEGNRSGTSETGYSVRTFDYNGVGQDPDDSPGGMHGDDIHDDRSRGRSEDDDDFMDRDDQADPTVTHQLYQGVMGTDDDDGPGLTDDDEASTERPPEVGPGTNKRRRVMCNTACCRGCGSAFNPSTRTGKCRIFFLFLTIILFGLTGAYLGIRFSMQPKSNEEGNNKEAGGVEAGGPVQPPTMKPTKEPFTSSGSRSDDISSILVEEGVDAEAMADPGTPEYEAYNWISEEDERELDPQDPDLKQRYAAAELYYGTGGKDWGEPSTVATDAGRDPPLSPSHECQWDFINCTDVTRGGETGGPPTSDLGSGEKDGSRRHLFLRRLTQEEDPSLTTTWLDDFDGDMLDGATSRHQSRQGGDGEATDSGGNTTDTTGIGNSTTGEIESGTVVGIYLKDRKLTGILPDGLSLMRSLEILDVSENELEGTIPSSMSVLLQLKSLRLNNNKFSGEIPSWIGNFQNLEELDLDYNEFTGEVPQEVCDLNISDFGANFAETLPEVSCTCCARTDGETTPLPPTLLPPTDTNSSIPPPETNSTYEEGYFDLVEFFLSQHFANSSSDSCYNDTMSLITGESDAAGQSDLIVQGFIELMGDPTSGAQGASSLTELLTNQSSSQLEQFEMVCPGQACLVEAFVSHTDALTSDMTKYPFWVYPVCMAATCNETEGEALAGVQFDFATIYELPNVMLPEQCLEQPETCTVGSESICTGGNETDSDGTPYLVCETEMLDFNMSTSAPLDFDEDIHLMTEMNGTVGPNATIEFSPLHPLYVGLNRSCHNISNEYTLCAADIELSYTSDVDGLSTTATFVNVPICLPESCTEESDIEPYISMPIEMLCAGVQGLNASSPHCNATSVATECSALSSGEEAECPINISASDATMLSEDFGELTASYLTNFGPDFSPLVSTEGILRDTSWLEYDEACVANDGETCAWFVTIVATLADGTEQEYLVDAAKLCFPEGCSSEDKRSILETLYQERFPPNAVDEWLEELPPPCYASPDACRGQFELVCHFLSSSNATDASCMEATDVLMADAGGNLFPAAGAYSEVFADIVESAENLFEVDEETFFSDDTLMAFARACKGEGGESCLVVNSVVAPESGDQFIVEVTPQCLAPICIEEGWEPPQWSASDSNATLSFLDEMYGLPEVCTGESPCMINTTLTCGFGANETMEDDDDFLPMPNSSTLCLNDTESLVDTNEGLKEAETSFHDEYMNITAGNESVWEMNLAEYLSGPWFGQYSEACTTAGGDACTLMHKVILQQQDPGESREFVFEISPYCLAKSCSWEYREWLVDHRKEAFGLQFVKGTLGLPEACTSQNDTMSNLCVVDYELICSNSTSPSDNATDDNTMCDVGNLIEEHEELSDAQSAFMAAHEELVFTDNGFPKAPSVISYEEAVDGDRYQDFENECLSMGDEYEVCSVDSEIVSEDGKKKVTSQPVCVPPSCNATESVPVDLLCRAFASNGGFTVPDTQTCTLLAATSKCEDLGMESTSGECNDELAALRGSESFSSAEANLLESVVLDGMNASDSSVNSTFMDDASLDEIDAAYTNFSLAKSHPTYATLMETCYAVGGDFCSLSRKVSVVADGETMEDVVEGYPVCVPMSCTDGNWTTAEIAAEIFGQMGVRRRRLQNTTIAEEPEESVVAVADVTGQMSDVQALCAENPSSCTVDMNAECGIRDDDLLSPDNSTGGDDSYSLNLTCEEAVDYLHNNASDGQVADAQEAFYDVFDEECNSEFSQICVEDSGEASLSFLPLESSDEYEEFATACQGMGDGYTICVVDSEYATTDGTVRISNQPVCVPPSCTADEVGLAVPVGFFCNSRDECELVDSTALECNLDAGAADEAKCLADIDSLKENDDLRSKEMILFVAGANNADDHFAVRFLFDDLSSDPTYESYMETCKGSGGDFCTMSMKITVEFTGEEKETASTSKVSSEVDIVGFPVCLASTCSEGEAEEAAKAIIYNHVLGSEESMRRDMRLLSHWTPFSGRSLRRRMQEGESPLEEEIDILKLCEAREADGEPCTVQMSLVCSLSDSTAHTPLDPELGAFTSSVIEDQGLGTADGDEFGSALSVSGDGMRIAVAAVNEKLTGIVRVYEYNINDELWTQLGGDIMGLGEEDRFGRSVSLSSDGSRVAIGADGSDVSGDGSGQVRVFQLISGEGEDVWTLVGEAIDGDAEGDGFGTSVALSDDGSWVVVGAPNSNEESGSVGVYQFVEGTWVSDATLKPSVGRKFGTSVSLVSGDSSESARPLYFAASSPEGGGADDETVTGGHVEVFTSPSGQQWEPVGESIVGRSGGVDDQFGFSISMALNPEEHLVVVVGSPKFKGVGIDMGRVEAFRFNEADGIWEGLGGTFDGEADGDNLGHSVALSADGTVLVAGSPGIDDPTKTASGSAYVYSFVVVAEPWAPLGFFSELIGEESGDQVGSSVSVSSSGHVVAVGAPDRGVDEVGEKGYFQVYMYE